MFRKECLLSHVPSPSYPFPLIYLLYFGLSETTRTDMPLTASRTNSQSASTQNLGTRDEEEQRTHFVAHGSVRELPLGSRFAVHGKTSRGLSLPSDGPSRLPLVARACRSSRVSSAEAPGPLARAPVLSHTAEACSTLQCTTMRILSLRILSLPIDRTTPTGYTTVHLMLGTTSSSSADICAERVQNGLRSLNRHPVVGVIA